MARLNQSFRGSTISIVLLTAFCLLEPARSDAQTGEIIGTVTDSLGQPVPYASVNVQGTTLGGRANSQGMYTIRGVPVGIYTLATRMVGYAPSQRPGVRVDAGRGTRVDFRVLAKPVPVRGVVIQTSPTMSVRVRDSAIKNYVTGKELHSMPVDDLEGAIQLKAGVLSHQGELHFRGGRGDEVLTIVNGIASRSPLDAQGIDLGLLSVSASEQVLGGMDARYGNALSGVINISTREGTDRFEGEVRVFTDRYGEEDKSFQNFARLSAALGGPFLFPRTNYFVSLEGTYSDTHLPSVKTHREHRFLDFIRLGNRQSNSARLSGKLTFRPTPDQKLNFELIRNSELVSEFHNRWNRAGFVQILQDSTAPTDGAVTTRFGTWSFYQVDSTYVPMNTAEHLPVIEDDYLQTAITWRHVVSESTLYNVRLSRQAWRSATDVLDRMPWEYQQQPNQYYDAQNRVDGSYYVTNGDYPFYESKETVTYMMNGDVSTSLAGHHLMAGGEVSYNDLGFLRTNFPNVVTGENRYGADRDEFRFYNPEGSFFLQDRWQHEGLVLNAGVRYDYFSVGNQISSAEVVDRLKTQVSPRIGVAHPISERDVMSFHYGRLFQVPDRQYLYQGRLISATTRGNPNLDAQTTTSYQLGVQHLFTRDVYGQFGVYFKDIYGLLTTVPQTVPGVATTVETYVNGDYASSRGVEVSLIKRFGRGFGGEVHYTYGNATGTASDPNRALPDQGNLRDQFKPTSEQPLRWDQRHTFTATLALGNERDWRGTFVFQFGSGFPYTPRAREERRENPEAVHSRRLPSASTLSFQGERYFRVWDQHVTIYLQATNLLDARNIANLQPSLWPPGALHSRSYEIYYTETGRAGGAFLTQDQDGDAREDWIPVEDARVFQPGRSIRVGLGVEF
ncbi:MAG TPA: TonB-dependent receptor [Candidatus Eisenbacteria bacterium]|nr:TonB-dependent receptor [Candidatus Eisenbacteria bacterium]